MKGKFLPFCLSLIKTPLLYILLFHAIGALHADILELRSGETLEGVVTGQDANVVNFRTASGNREVKKKEIRFLRFGYTAEENKREAELKKEVMEADAIADLNARQAALLRLQKELFELIRRQEARRRMLASLEKEYRDQLKQERAGINSLIRSAVLPGWGHRYTGHNRIGWSYTGASGASLFFALYSYSQIAPAKQAYQDSVNMVVLASASGSPVHPFVLRQLLVDEKYRSYQKSIQYYNNGLILTGVIYLASLGHLAFNLWRTGTLFPTGSGNSEGAKKSGVSLQLSILPEATYRWQGDKTGYTVFAGLDLFF